MKLITLIRHIKILSDWKNWKKMKLKNSKIKVIIVPYLLFVIIKVWTSDLNLVFLALILLFLGYFFLFTFLQQIHIEFKGFG